METSPLLMCDKEEELLIRKFYKKVECDHTPPTSDSDCDDSSADKYVPRPAKKRVSRNIANDAEVFSLVNARSKNTMRLHGKHVVFSSCTNGSAIVVSCWMYFKIWTGLFLNVRDTSLIVAIMETHQKQVNLLWACLLALAQLSNRSRNRMLVAKKSVKTIIVVMNDNVGNERIQENGCSALGKLALCLENEVLIAKKGGIASIITAMEKHPRNSTLQNNGCGALSNLGYKNLLNSALIARHGGISVVLAAMKMHAQTPNIQTSGCGAIRNLAYKCPENKALIAKLGGIDLVRVAMSTFPSDAVLQTNGCSALSNLAFDETNRAFIIAAGGVAAVVDAMLTHPMDADIQQNGCGVLRNLASTVASSFIIANGGGIEIIIAAMRLHLTDANVQICGCDALYNFVTHHLENAVTVALANGIPTIQDALFSHPSDIILQKSANDVLDQILLAIDLSRS